MQWSEKDLHIKLVNNKCTKNLEGAHTNLRLFIVIDDVFDATLGKLPGAERRRSGRSRLENWDGIPSRRAICSSSASPARPCKKKNPSACRLMFNVIIARVIQSVHVAVRAPTQLHDYADPPAFLSPPPTCRDINCLMHFFTGSQWDRGGL